MSEFIQHGEATYRTKLFPTTEQAFAFAKCLHNNDRFTDVEVCQSKKAPGRWFVQFRPSNPARVADMLDRQQASRQQRAETGSFLMIADRGFTWVVNQETGGTYRTTERSCDCPDAVYRLKGAILCKHSLAVNAAQVEVEVAATFDEAA